MTRPATAMISATILLLLVAGGGAALSTSSGAQVKRLNKTTALVQFQHTGAEVPVSIRSESESEGTGAYVWHGAPAAKVRATEGLQQLDPAPDNVAAAEVLSLGDDFFEISDAIVISAGTLPGTKLDVRIFEARQIPRDKWQLCRALFIDSRPTSVFLCHEPGDIAGSVSNFQDEQVVTWGLVPADTAVVTLTYEGGVVAQIPTARIVAFRLADLGNVLSLTATNEDGTVLASEVFQIQT